MGVSGTSRGAKVERLYRDAKITEIYRGGPRKWMRMVIAGGVAAIIGKRSTAESALRTKDVGMSKTASDLRVLCVLWLLQVRFLSFNQAL